MSTAQVYIHLGNAQSGETDSAGPFDFAQITYGSFVRVENVADGVEDFTIATMGGNGLWLWDDGSEWTDLTVSTQPPSLPQDRESYSDTQDRESYA